MLILTIRWKCYLLWPWGCWNSLQCYDGSWLFQPNWRILGCCHFWCLQCSPLPQDWQCQRCYSCFHIWWSIWGGQQCFVSSWKHHGINYADGPKFSNDGKVSCSTTQSSIHYHQWGYVFLAWVFRCWRCWINLKISPTIGQLNNFICKGQWIA